MSSGRRCTTDAWRTSAPPPPRRSSEAVRRCADYRRWVRRPQSSRPPAHGPRLLIALTAVVVLTVTTAASCGDEAHRLLWRGRPRHRRRDRRGARLGDRPRRRHGQRPGRRHPGRPARRGRSAGRARVRWWRSSTRRPRSSGSSGQERWRRDASSAVPSARTLTAVRRGTDKRADEAFDAARDAAAKITDPQTCATRCSPRSTSAAAAVRRRRRGGRRRRSAVGPAGRGRRCPGPSARSPPRSGSRPSRPTTWPKATVDALTLRAPVAGVVQLGRHAGPAVTPSADRPVGRRPGGAGAPARPAASQGATCPGSTPRCPSAGRGQRRHARSLTVVDTGRLGLARRGRRDRRAAGQGRRAPPTVELDAATGATLPRPPSARSTCCRPPRRGAACRTGSASTLGTGSYADGRPAPTPRPGMSAVVAPAGPRRPPTR